MNIHPLSFKLLVAVGAFLGLVTVSNPAMAAPLTVQTQATAGNAAAEESGATIASSALIAVLVTNTTGNPVTTLGSTIGNGSSAITLPQSWSLSIPAVPPGGCLVTPTQFINQRNGVYLIRVVPFVNNANCRWLSGDYIYRVQIDTSLSDGSALGTLTIP